MHHSPQAIKRYVNTFLRVVTLYRQGMTESEIAFVVGASVKLVKDYLGVYEQAQGRKHQLEKLNEEIIRVNGLGGGKKKEAWR